MFVFANFISAVAVVLGYVIKIASWLIIIRALISWVNPDPSNMIVQFLHKTTEPMLRPIRRIVPMYNMGLDISPILAILVLWFARIFVVQSLFDLAQYLSR